MLKIIVIYTFISEVLKLRIFISIVLVVLRLLILSIFMLGILELRIFIWKIVLVLITII